MTSLPTGSSGSRSAAHRPTWRPSPLTYFLGVLLLVLAVYTEMAMDMQWRTVAGRIGAGFFPRIVGFCGLALCLVAIVRSLRPRQVDEDDLAEEPEFGHQPRALLYMVVAGCAFFALLVPLGAIITSALFLIAMLFYLDRGRGRLNVAVAVLLPMFMYLLLQVALNAGLPKGILPML